MTEKRTITIHNKISSDFKEIHVDGAYGGLTPRGLINLNFYAERAPIPKSSEFEITATNTVGELLSNSSDSKTGILREYGFGIYMDIAVAKSIIELLNTKISEYENVLKSVKTK
jgi:hypothetical protein